MKSRRIVPSVIAIAGFIILIVGGLSLVTSPNKTPANNETPSCILITGDLDISCLEDIGTERYPKDNDGIQGDRVGTNCIKGSLPSPIGAFSTGVNLEDTAEVCPLFLRKQFRARGELIQELELLQQQP